MSVEVKVRLLKAAKQEPTGVKELAKKLNHRPETIISLIEEMEEHGLLEKKTEKRSSRGRPKLLVKPTVLGEDYIATYDTLESKPLRSRRTDLIHATRDAEYAERLSERGLSPFSLALELNQIVTAHTRNNT